MSDEIMSRDKQVGIEMGWHNKTDVVKEGEIITFKRVFNYEIERLPLSVRVGPKYVKLSEWSAFIATDDGLPVGKPVPDTYGALTNERFFEIVQNALGGTGAIVESAGTIMNRSRRFITVRLSANNDFKIGDREFKNRIGFLDSIDGSTFFHAVNTSTCVVCANTFQIVKGDKSGEFNFKIRHTAAGLPEKIENMEKVIDSLCGVKAEFQAALTAANEMPISQRQAQDTFAGWIGEGAESLSPRAKNTVGRLVQLYRGGGGNRGETLLDAFSAVTDYYGHESSGGEDKPGFLEKQYLSSEFGAGKRAKEDFFRAVFSNDKKTGVFTGIRRDNLQVLQARGASLIPALLAN